MRTFLLTISALIAGFVAGVAVDRTVLTQPKPISERVVGKWLLEGRPVEFLADGTCVWIISDQKENEPPRPPYRRHGTYVWLDAEHMQVRLNGEEPFSAKVTMDDCLTLEK